MKKEKRIYTAPTVELLYTDNLDVISTSGFNGGDHVFGKSIVNDASYEI